MPRPKKGKRLGGSPSHQRRILSNLAASLIDEEEIQTTVARAKMLRPYVEKIITKARRAICTPGGWCSPRSRTPRS